MPARAVVIDVAAERVELREQLAAVVEPVERDAFAERQVGQPLARRGRTAGAPGRV